MLNKIIVKLILPFAKLYYFSKHKNIWKIKEALNGAKNNILLKIYNDYFFKYGSWIGYNSTFKGIPCFPHGVMGIFISGGSKVGKNVVIFQQVTIGSNTLEGSNNGSPVIGDDVYIGSGAKIIGNIVIGDNCRIGANAVVYEDMLPHSVAVQSPTRIIQKENLDNRFYSIGENGQWTYYDNGYFVKNIKKR